MTFQYQSDDPSGNNVFQTFGNLNLSINGGEIADVTGTLGVDAATPGLKVVNGTVTDVNIKVMGDINVLGLKAHIPDADPLLFVYDNSNANDDSVFTLSGEIVVSTQTGEALARN